MIEQSFENPTISTHIFQIPPQDTWNSDFIGFILRFEPEGVPSFAFENKFPSSQLNYYRAGGLLRHKRYKVSVRSYNLNGKGASNGSAVAWAWTQEDGETDCVEFMISGE